MNKRIQLREGGWDVELIPSTDADAEAYRDDLWRELDLHDFDYVGFLGEFWAEVDEQTGSGHSFWPLGANPVRVRRGQFDTYGPRVWEMWQGPAREFDTVGKDF